MYTPFVPVGRPAGFSHPFLPKNGAKKAYNKELQKSKASTYNRRSVRNL